MRALQLTLLFLFLLFAFTIGGSEQFADWMLGR